MLNHKSQSVYRREVLKELKERGYDNPTGEQVLDHLFRDLDNNNHSKYTVRQWKQTEVNTLQRFNALWVYPLYAVCIAPFKWLLTGDTGVKTESKAYRTLKFLLGEPK